MHFNNVTSIHDDLLTKNKSLHRTISIISQDSISFRKCKEILMQMRNKISCNLKNAFFNFQMNCNTNELFTLRKLIYDSDMCNRLVALDMIDKIIVSHSECSINLFKLHMDINEHINEEINLKKIHELQRKLAKDSKH